jgi:hypothetical protein
MKLLRIRRPSPAMVVAMLALLVAMSSSAGADPIGEVSALIRGKSIAANAITSKHVKNRSLRGVDFARGQLPRGPAGPAGPQGPAGGQGPPGPAGASAAKYWAGIQENASISRQSGGISANLETNGGTTNHYLVRFPTDVRNCAYNVTGGDMGTINNNQNIFARIGVAARSANDDNEIVVQVHSYASDFTPIQDDFFVAVFC